MHHFKQTICLFRHRTQHRLQHKAGQREPFVDGEAIHKGVHLVRRAALFRKLFTLFLVFVQQLFFAGDERALRSAGRRRFVQARKAFRLPIERALQLRPLLPGHGLRRSVGLFLRSVQRLVVGLHLSTQRRRVLALHQRAAISFLRLKSTAGKFVVQCFAGGGFFFRQGAALLFSFRAALSGQRFVAARGLIGLLCGSQRFFPLLQ